MIKKILFGLSALALFAACTDEYTDWAQPQKNAPVQAKTVDWSVAAAQQAAFVLDDIQDETVKLFNVTLPEGVVAESFNVNLTAEGSNYPDYNITADGQGNVSVADLQRATTEMFTIEAIERTFAAVVSSDVNVKGSEGSAAVRLIADAFNVSIVPQKPQFNPFVFFIGATDGWSTPDQKLASESGDGIYTGFLYIADPNGWGVEFKFQKRAGDWADDSQLNSNNLNEITGDFEKTGDNIKASTGEGVYYVELNLAQGTLKGTLVNTMGIIGDFNGWGGDVAMTWNPDEFCYEAVNPGVTANGWKFRMNSDWGINLGCNDSVEPSTKISDLVANGKNIGAVGNTIKLYPTRKTSDKIYCTVE